MAEGPCECGARVPDGDGDEFHPPLVFLEGRNEGGVLLGLLCVFIVVPEVYAKFYLNENESAQLFIEVGGAGVRDVPDSSGVYEVRCYAVASLEEICLYVSMSLLGVVPMGVAGWVCLCTQHRRLMS